MINRPLRKSTLLELSKAYLRKTPMNDLVKSFVDGSVSDRDNKLYTSGHKKKSVIMDISISKKRLFVMMNISQFNKSWHTDYMAVDSL